MDWKQLKDERVLTPEGLKPLNGMFYAVLKHGENAKDSPLCVRETSGMMVASDNPVDVQLRCEELYPNLGGERNSRGKHISFCRMPTNLDHRSVQTPD